MLEQQKPDMNINGNQPAEEPSYRASEAFGEDRNVYAYPSSRGLSGYGVASTICGLCGIFFPLTIFAGIGIGIAGVARRRSDVLSWVGIVLSVLILVLDIFTMVKVCSDPNAMGFMQQMWQ